MIIIFKPSTKESFFKSEAFLEEKSLGLADFEFEENGKYMVKFNKEAFNIISKYKLIDVTNNNISSFALNVNFKKFEHLNWGEKKGQLWFNNDGSYYLTIIPDLLQWNKSFNLITFVNYLDEYFLENNEISFSRNNILLEEGISFSIKGVVDKNIYLAYNNVLNKINTEFGVVFNKIQEEDKKNAIISIFSFPSEIQNSCEQYLVYFSQFMKDLGVNVDSNIQIKAKKTLFTITPKDSSQALTQIRDSLNIYLELALIKDIELYSEESDDIGVKQLLANIYHLRSQLMLSNSIIQMKEATIESLKLTNYQKTTLIELNSKNEEKTFDDLITINELELKGIKINLPEIFRRIKRKLK